MLVPDYTDALINFAIHCAKTNKSLASFVSEDERVNSTLKRNTRDTFSI